MEKIVIFIGGAPGIGKSQFINQLRQEVSFYYIHLSSQIKEITGKSLDNIPEKQLYELVHQLISSTKSSNVIIEGHYKKKHSDTHQLSSIFPLSINYYLHLSVSTDSNYLRLKNRRPNCYYEKSMIKEKQEKSLFFALELANKLNSHCYQYSLENSDILHTKKAILDLLI